VYRGVALHGFAAARAYHRTRDDHSDDAMSTSEPITSAWQHARRRLPLGSRADAVELLDGGCLSLPEIEQNLVDLARLNLLPGGTSASIAGIERLVGIAARTRILDAGTGRGDMPLAFARRGWPTVGLDVNPDVLLVARRETAHQPLVEIVAGEGCALPFDDDSFDVAHASLFVHHFGPAEAVAILRELRRVARRGVVINDLRRGLLPLLATGVGVLAFGRSCVTWSDGIASARRSYTLTELDELISEAGLRIRWRSNRWQPRVVTVADAGA
jgi:SAM-dependent methyltransferase